MCEYWLGGKGNFAADRAAAEQAVEAFTQLPAAVAAEAAFRTRAIRYRADEGIRQFLDLGCGLPAGDPVNVIAQAAATVDFGLPVVVLLASVLHLIPDSDDPYGLDPVEPGVVGVPAWHPETEAATKAPAMAWCGVGRKPSAA
jgi:hypothetical protein